MRHLFAGWMGCIGLVAMLAGGAPAAGAAPAPGQGVSLLTDTDEYARAVLTDGQLTLSLEATVGEDGTRSISVKRADGTLFYAVVMDAQHTALYRQYGPVAVRSEDGKRVPRIMKWGLIPHWSKDSKLAYSTINARSEDFTTKPAFRDAWQ